MDRLGEERGESLLEVLITIMIMGTGLVAVVAALGSVIIASDTHHSMAQGEVIVRDFGEQIKEHARNALEVIPCPDADDLDPTPGTDAVDPALAGDGWSATITKVWWWIPDSNVANFPNGTWKEQQGDCTTHYQTTCGIALPACAPGLQRAQFEVSNSRTDYADMTITARVIVRRNNALTVQ
jgi:type II secretory pathway pseudopilin PulG